jgi:hypothetical protein
VDEDCTEMMSKSHWEEGFAHSWGGSHGDRRRIDRCVLGGASVGEHEFGARGTVVLKHFKHSSSSSDILSAESPSLV